MPHRTVRHMTGWSLSAADRCGVVSCFVVDTRAEVICQTVDFSSSASRIRVILRDLMRSLRHLASRDISSDIARFGVIPFDLAIFRLRSRDVAAIMRDLARSRRTARDVMLSVLTGGWHGSRAAVHHLPASGGGRLLHSVPRRRGRHLAPQVYNRKSQRARAQCRRPVNRITGRTADRDSERGTYLSDFAQL